MRRQVEFVNVSELSVRLSLSTRTVRTYIRDAVDPLPAFRVGGRLLFSSDEVRAWLERRRVAVVDADEIATDLLRANKRGG